MPTLPDIAALDALLAEEEEIRRRGHEAVDHVYHDNIAAILRVKALVQSRPKVSPNDAARESAPTTKTLPAATLNGFPGLRAAIREVIDRRPTRFTLDDVVDEIHAHYPHVQLKRVAVSSELWRMGKQKSISIIESGSGNRPNVYKKGV